MKKSIHRMQQEEGFTLVELLIVIVVIGVLGGIVLFGTATFRQDSVVACGDANDRVLASAQQAYAAKNNGATATTKQLADAGYISDDDLACS